MKENEIESELMDIPKALESTFSTQNVNSAISLHEGAVEIDGQVLEGQFCNIEFRWLPSPSLILSVPSRLMNHHSIDWSERVQVVAPGLGGTGEALPLSSGDKGSTFLCLGLVRARSLPVEYLTFEVANGYRILGSGIRRERSVWAGRTVLEAGEYRVTLDETNDSSVFREVAESRGFVLTHTGTLERIGHPISIDEAEPVIEALAWLLSFVRGAFTGPILICGWSHGEMASFDWGSQRVDAWTFRDTWFPDYTPGVLEAIFPKLRDLLARDPWSESLPLAIDLCLRANGVGEIETSLLLSHAALELVAWLVLVEDTGSVTPEAFDRLRFSDRLRSLLAWADIPASIPQECKDLRAWAGQEVDGPHALSILRNGIVHPSKRDRVYRAPVHARIDSAQLAVRYVELALLRIFGYGGMLQNRLRRRRWRGEAEKVPWSD